jgi:hypothetical protein
MLIDPKSNEGALRSWRPSDRCAESGALMHVLDLRYHAKIMRSLFRLLLWLSITVLSFQGSAAIAAAQLDRPAHETMVMTGHSHHQGVERSAAEHCSKADSKMVSPHTKCAACASCCVGAAAPPARLPALHVPPLASFQHPAAEASMTSIVPAGLERPPRPDFA